MKLCKNSGRPRRQQAYRRANTSLTLTSNSGLDTSDADPYISCTSILDRFGSSGGSTGPDSSAINGNGTRKMSAGAIKVTILPTFYKHLFLTKVSFADFINQQFGFVIFCLKEINAKTARKMLVKFITGFPSWPARSPTSSPTPVTLRYWPPLH